MFVFSLWQLTIQFPKVYHRITVDSVSVQRRIIIANQSYGIFTYVSPHTWVVVLEPIVVQSCFTTALDSGTDNHSKNVLRKYEILRRCQIPITKHKVPKPSRWLIFPLVLGAKIAKGKENIPALRFYFKIYRC